MDSVRSVALGVWIAAGSRLEPVELGGISHFIEHLIFKGSDKYSASEIAHIFDDMGAEPNASTSKEHTLVNARLLDEDLDKAFEVIAEMVARPTFADLDQEREVVLEEVAMYEDSPPELIHDDLCEVVFGEHPLGRPIIGHYETLAALDLDTVRGYHDAHYVNPGIVIARRHVDTHDGELEEVREILGRPPSAGGVVVHGDKRGRALGVPTANVDVEAGTIFPGRGVYAARAFVDGRWYRTAVNIGHNPTFQSREEPTTHVTVEAFLLGFSGDIYDREIRLDFLHKIRDERRFESAEALVAQMRLDIAAAGSLADPELDAVGLAPDAGGA